MNEDNSTSSLWFFGSTRLGNLEQEGAGAAAALEARTATEIRPIGRMHGMENGEWTRIDGGTFPFQKKSVTNQLEVLSVI